MIRYTLPLLILLGASVCFAGDSKPGVSLQTCLNYEPDTVTLVGSISPRTFTNATDQKETVWVLKLDKAACVDQSAGGDEFDVRRAKITDVQLVLGPDMFAKYRGLVGKKVTATGTLFGEHTAHHFTPVLLMVKTIELVP